MKYSDICLPFVSIQLYTMLGYSSKLKNIIMLKNPWKYENLMFWPSWDGNDAKTGVSNLLGFAHTELLAVAYIAQKWVPTAQCERT